MSSRHITAEQAERLRESGAFEGRAFEVGDWVRFDDCRGNGWDQYVGLVHKIHPSTDKTYNLLGIQLGAYHEDTCLLLPSESDLMDALERATGCSLISWDIYCDPEDDYDKRYSLVHTNYNETWSHSNSTTRIVALFNALCAVYEARKSEGAE